MRPPRHRIAHHAVDADAGEHRRGNREESEQERAEALTRDRLGRERGQRVDARNRDVAIDCSHLPAQQPGERRRFPRARIAIVNVPQLF